MKDDNSYTIENNKFNNQEWARLLQQFDDASIYHTLSYAAVMYGQDNVHHLILKNNGTIVAIAQIGLRRFPLFHTATANVHWGPLWRKKDQAPDYNNFALIVASLKNEYAIKRKLLLRLWPNEVDNSHSEIKNIILNNNFIHSSTDRPYRTLRLDITPSVDVLRKNLDQKWRNQLNRAEKNNLTINEGTSDDFYQIFLKLQKEMLERKNFTPGVNYEQYRQIQNGLTEEQKMRIFTCESSGEPIAIAMCSCIGDTGIYMLGAMGDNGLKLNGSNLLQWLMLKWLKDHGCKYYDLGGIDPEENPGVYRYKCGVAGKSGEDIKYIGQYIFYNNISAKFLNVFIGRTKSLRKKFFEFKNG